MPDWPFSRITAELLSILQDRYPNGLTASLTEPATTPAPTGEGDVKVAYAVLRNPNEPSQGWKNLKVQPTDTVASKGLTDMCSVAFALLDPNADENDVQFHVEFPTLEDEEL